MNREIKKQLLKWHAGYLVVIFVLLFCFIIFDSKFKGIDFFRFLFNIEDLNNILIKDLRWSGLFFTPITHLIFLIFLTKSFVKKGISIKLHLVNFVTGFIYYVYLISFFSFLLFSHITSIGF
ncbi:MAG: hypothetical protein ACI9AR_000034 [Flavobacteriaceae bacterium]|jgi:hypothetical protein